MFPIGSNMNPPVRLRAVFFDAVGTLIHPDPPVAEVYAAASRRFGFKLSAADVWPRFVTAFTHQENLDQENGQRTDEARELRRWQDIVAAVLDDVADPAACFTALYEHFGQPAAWHCDPDAASLLENLHAKGYQVGIASNFDHRLRGVAAGLPPLQNLSPLVLSTEVGWKKPAPAFFQAMCQAASLPPESILYVGDHPDLDFEPAIRAGMAAVLFDPANKHVHFHGPRIVKLTDLQDHVGRC